MTTLKYSIQPETLQQIGHVRLGKFLDGFRADLEAANVVLPNAIPDDANYFNAVAAMLSQFLPDRLRAALFALEWMASPENSSLLDSAWQRHLPRVCSMASPLDRALEVWFLSPEVLLELAAPLEVSSTPTVSMLLPAFSVLRKAFPNR